MSQSFSNNINSLNTAVNVWNNCTVVDDRSQILTWLSPLEPRLRHQDVQGNRVENVGEWLLQTEEFRNWYAGNGGDEFDKRVLFCYGDPGVGKTFISSLVVDRLCDQAQGKNAAVACFYFDFTAQKEQAPTSMLGSLLKQVVGGLAEVPAEVAQAYEDQKKVLGGRVPQLSDIVKFLQTTSSKTHTFICIDALDECVAAHRVRILNSLNQILHKSPSTRIFVTGRPHIQPEIGRHLGGRVTSVSISPSRGDIIRYIRNRLAEDTTPEAMDSPLEADILRKIPEDISEIFLLVSLNIDAILQETTIHRRRQRLSTMTDGVGLGGAYGATLGRIKGQGGEKSRLGMAALMWISHSERPLRTDELCHALAVETGSANLNSDNVPAIETLIACCQGLVLVDKEASTVRLIHFTFQEYLRAHPEVLGTVHSTMAETYLSYLNSRKIKTLSTSSSPDVRGTPFLEYSSLYWGIHAKRELSDCAKFLALKLFDDYNNHISSKILLEARNTYPHFVDFDNLSWFSGLHYASMFGIVEIVALLLEVEGCDINQDDCVGNSPLIWASRGGHEGVVKILLGREDIDPEKPDRWGQTPLTCAADSGCEGVVKILLGWGDVDPNKPNDEGKTPLFCAAKNGHEGVVKILLGRHDVDPNEPDSDGDTPLLCAAWSGHQEVVKMLLEREDVGPNEPDVEGKTPLLWAAMNGHEGVVKILLGRDDVDPNEPDSDGDTPLICATCRGHEGVVKILLSREDVGPNEPDAEGKTPLYRASENGHGGIVKILLGRDDVDPNTPDDEGKTPLYCATENEHDGVVEILLGRDDVNPSGLTIQAEHHANRLLDLAMWE